MNPWSDFDQQRMRDAIALAKEAAAAGEVPVGAVATRGQRVVGRGHNTTIVDSDPTGHAEIVALRDAARTEHNHRLAGVTLYVTLEPCAMCMGAMLQARVSRVVFGAYDDRAGAAGSVIDISRVDAFNHRIEVNGGLLADEAAELLGCFFADRRAEQG